MNEQRQEAYLNLIHNLLACPIGEEPEILAANRDLSDAGFLQTVEAVAEMESHQGDENKANWLRHLAIQLRTMLNLPLAVNAEQSLQPVSQNSLRTYLQLLDKVLQATVNSKGDEQIVYPILAANPDILNNTFLQIFQICAKANLFKVEKQQEAEAIARSIIYFSQLIELFPLGSKSNNVEIAIAGYEISSTVFTGDTTSEFLAYIQMLLANAYRERIAGKKAENLEKAIVFFEATLGVFTREAFPNKWAYIQHILGVTYYDRVQGQKPENLEKAISCYQAALQVCTREEFPKLWAGNQHNLGVVHNDDEMPGEKAQNIEVAIAHFQAALQVFTRKDFLDKWANTHNDLGNAYRKRVCGEEVENLEAAMISYQAALQVLTLKEFPTEWAMVQDNLGYIYCQKSRWESVENLEIAITCYHAALQVYSRDVLPEKWANTLFMLGITYCKRIRGDKAENLEKAIGCYQDALQVHTQESFPHEWAKIQHELGIAYNKRIFGDKAENLELSITYSQKALPDREAFPESWAATQNSLGLAYSQRIYGDKTQNLENALATYKAALQIYTCETFPEKWAGIQGNLANIYEELGKIEASLEHSKLALEIFTPESFPVDCFSIGRNLGECAFENKQWIVAIQGYEQAIAAVESSREWATTEITRREILENAIDVYAKMIQACVQVGDFTKAIETAERSKTRNLVELIFNRDLKTIFPLEVVTQLEKLRDEITAGQYELQNGREENPTTLAQRIHKLQKQYKELQDSYLSVGSGFKVKQFQTTLDEQTAVIEWYFTNAGLETFVITCNKLERLNSAIMGEDLRAFVDWVNEYLGAYYREKTEWIHSLASRLSRLAEILHLEDVLKLVPENCSRLVLIPHRYLHLFPLHALPLANNGSCLLDRFGGGVRYAPSCQLLQISQNQKRPDFQKLFAIQNPTDDLPYANAEVAAIASSFPVKQVLVKQQGTKMAIQNSQSLASSHCIHLSCHGFFNPHSPLEPFLLLANDERLTLEEIFSLNLNQCRLVTLSACESGLTDFTSVSDEYIGLPSGFLYAGSPSVVSSLWTISDLSTALLTIKFYDNLQTGYAVAVALNHAQLWLRDVTKAELIAWLAAKPLPTMRQDLRRQLHKLQDKEQPFKEPFYWAAFCAIGQ